MKKYIVRYGAMRCLGIVKIPDEQTQDLFRGVSTIVKTQRGLEAAVILCETTDEKLAEFPNLVAEKNVFIRKTTQEDEDKLSEIKSQEKEDFNRCQRIVERMRVNLKLVRVEQIFSRERVVVYYVADGRVDFRELVRVLAAEFKTRIEMKQIGVRDEAKLLADVGDCGREICCNTYLTAMLPVSMKMGKLQKATLDPTKVSGRCGRLKCCLRYEFDTYNELHEQSPAIGRVVWTPAGRGKVCAQELFAKRVVVDLDDGVRQSFELSEIDLTERQYERRQYDRQHHSHHTEESTSYYDDQDENHLR